MLLIYSQYYSCGRGDNATYSQMFQRWKEGMKIKQYSSSTKYVADVSLFIWIAKTSQITSAYYTKYLSCVTPPLADISEYSKTTEA